MFRDAQGLILRSCTHKNALTPNIDTTQHVNRMELLEIKDVYEEHVCN